MRTEFELTFNIIAPVISQKAGVLPFGTDSGYLVENNRQVLPGTLIKGNIRHALNYAVDILRSHDESKAQELNEYIKAWFGSENSHDNAFTPNRAKTHFARYWVAETELAADAYKQRRNRIKIGENGTVEKGSLLIIDTPYPTGQEIAFTGKIYLTDCHEKERDDFESWVNKAIKTIQSMGSYKNVGFGRVASVSLKKVPQSLSEPPQTLSIADTNIDETHSHLTIRYRPLEPFCIAKPHVNNSNRFESYRHIAGNILKALLVKQLREERSDSELTKMNVDNWVVKHAFPIKAENTLSKIRPYQPQISLFKNSYPATHHEAKNTWYDAAFVNDANALLTFTPKLTPTFNIDWKESDHSELEELIGKPHTPKTQLQLHTAINPTTEQSEESALFSMELIVPDETDWLGEIDLSLLTQQERQIAISELKTINNTILLGLGKTGGPVSFDIVDSTNKTRKAESKEQHTLALVLQTECIMFTQHTVEKYTANDRHASLHDIYNEYWQSISDNGLTLSHFYATQQLRGGEYLHRRFRHEKYRPYWLTQPGSVFVLNVDKSNQTDVFELVNQWLDSGLPLPQTKTEDSENSNWKHSPYINRNGFGEIALLRDFSEHGIQLLRTE